MSIEKAKKDTSKREKTEVCGMSGRKGGVRVNKGGENHGE